MMPINIKPIDVKSSKYIDFGVENNNKDPKSKVRIWEYEYVRISRYRNILQKATFQIKPKKFLWLKKLKILCCNICNRRP